MLACSASAIGVASAPYAPPPVRNDSSGATGSHTMNAEPTPRVLSTLTSPSISRASRRLIVSPSPAPATGLLLRRPTCTNGSKIAARQPGRCTRRVRTIYKPQAFSAV